MKKITAILIIMIITCCIVEHLSISKASVNDDVVITGVNIRWQKNIVTTKQQKIDQLTSMNDWTYYEMSNFSWDGYPNVNNRVTSIIITLTARDGVTFSDKMNKFILITSIGYEIKQLIYIDEKNVMLSFEYTTTGSAANPFPGSVSDSEPTFEVISTSTPPSTEPSETPSMEPSEDPPETPTGSPSSTPWEQPELDSIISAINFQTDAITEQTETISNQTQLMIIVQGLICGGVIGLGILVKWRFGE